MATCNDCIHGDICHNRIHYHADEDEFFGYLLTDKECHCEHFKDASKLVELPCKVGDYLEWDNGLGELFYLEVIGFDMDTNGKVLRYLTEEVILEVFDIRIKRIVTEDEMKLIINGDVNQNEI